MSIKIEQVKVIDPQSKYHQQTVDILIEHNQIRKIGDLKSATTDEIVQVEDLHISPGFFDLRVSTGEPGQEYRETLKSASEAALAGGITGFALMPESTPPIDNSDAISSILKKSKDLPVNIYPIGALSKKQEGKELTEMYDMVENGALGFCDSNHSISNSKLLELALNYSSSLNVPIFHTPNDNKLAWGGVANEHVASTLSGLRGIPEIAEEIGVNRDLLIARHSQSQNLVLAPITLEKSLAVIQKAQSEGLAVKVATGIAYLFFNDNEIKEFDSNFKIFPPLRKESDRQALVHACINGEIDAIFSDHTPWDEDAKMCEFEIAKPGMSGLETLFPALNTLLNGNLERLVELIAINPRKILKLAIPKIEEGENCEFTLYLPNAENHIQKENLKSKGRNNPFVGKTLKGKVVRVVI